MKKKIIALILAGTMIFGQSALATEPDNDVQPDEAVIENADDALEDDQETMMDDSDQISQEPSQEEYTSDDDEVQTESTESVVLYDDSAYEIEEEDIPTVLEADNVVSTGSCGANATWKLDANGTMVISGTGKLYSEGKLPDWDAWNTARRETYRLVVEEGITSIGSGLFQRNASHLQSITLPSTVTAIEASAFSDCGGVTKIVLPDGLESIGNNAFESCSSLSAIDLPSHLKSIGDRAFLGCNSLKSVRIPASVTKIGTAAFNGCPNLSSFTVDENNRNYVAESGVLFDYMKQYIISVSGALPETFAVPDGVKTIPAYAFSGCSTLKTLILPDSVSEIEESAFASCNNLKSITWSQNITKIADRAFSYCGFTSITIPGHITDIGSSAFYGCSNLTSVTLEEGVNSIGEGVFSLCKNLLTLYIPQSVNSIGRLATDPIGLDASMIIVAPAGSYAETFANNNGFIFKNASELDDVESYGWHEDENGRSYVYNDVGVRYRNVKKWIDGACYWFGADGYVQVGWIQKQQNKTTNTYYADARGVLCSGWQQIDGKWYYLNTDSSYYLFGAMQTGTVWIDGKLYLFASDGSWVESEGWHQELYKDQSGNSQIQTFYVLEDGTLRTGWYQEDDDTYYFDLETGVMYSGGEFVIDGESCKFDKDGHFYRDEDIAGAVCDLIEQIGTVDLDSGDRINRARAAYDNLDQDQKALVTNYDVLTAAEEVFAVLVSDDTMDKINAIGTVTSDSGERIAAAREAYDALTDAQKALVTNYDVLTEAEKLYRELIGQSSLGWHSDHIGRWYVYDENGNYYFGEQEQIDGKLYWFGSDGYVMTGWIQPDPDRYFIYYAGETGALVEGWQQIDEKWYYFGPSMAWGSTTIYDPETGQDKCYVFTDQGEWIHGDGEGLYEGYYFYEDGSVYRGWMQIDGDWYCFGSTGKMRAGGANIFADPDDDAYRCLFSEEGKWIRGEGWHTVGGSTYYLDQENKAVVGWLQLGSDRYYLNYGTLYKEAEPWRIYENDQDEVGKLYIFYPDGRLVQEEGWDVRTDWKEYYVDSDHSLVTGFRQIDGDWYYFDPDLGYCLRYAQRVIGDDFCQFDENGRMISAENAVERVQSLINEIGTVNITSKRKIEDARGACNYQLPEGGKERLNNYDVLEAAEAEYQRLVENGIPVGWQTVDKEQYYIDENGYAVTGWFPDDKNWYYFDEDSGRLQKGWITIDGEKYYLDEETGESTYGWKQIAGDWYYFDYGMGIMQTGWQKVGGTWYYMNTSGVRQTGWKKIDSKWYLLDANGRMLTGWQKDNDAWYYMDRSGAMQTGWQKSGNVWYYFNKSGVMQTGWQKIGNVWYYFNSSGAMQRGWQKISNVWYYFNDSGAMQTGWQKISNVWYYFNSSGAMQTGWKSISGKWYYFNSSGAMQTGWITVSGKSYYMYSDGHMATSTWIGKYYVDASGVWTKTK